MPSGLIRFTSWCVAVLVTGHTLVVDEPLRGPDCAISLVRRLTSLCVSALTA